MYKTLSEEKKQAKKEDQKNYYKKLKSYKDKLLLEKNKKGEKVANYQKERKKEVQKRVKI